MANVRKLKKKIETLISEVISDCFIYSELHPDSNKKEVSTVLSDAVALRNDLIRRVNNPEKQEASGSVRSFYKNIENDLIKGVDKLFSRLSVLAGKKK
jgi:hypothetical protein